MNNLEVFKNTNIIGKTVSEVEYPWKYDKIILTFTDGTKLIVKEVGYEGQLEVRVNKEIVMDMEDEKY